MPASLAHSMLPLDSRVFEGRDAASPVFLAWGIATAGGLARRSEGRVQLGAWVGRMALHRVGRQSRVEVVREQLCLGPAAPSSL